MAVIVVDTTAVNQTQVVDNSILGFRSVLLNSAITGEDEDPNFPFSNCLDFRDNTKYSPLIESGTIIIDITQTSTQTIDYFAFAIHNSQDAGLTGTYEIDDGTGYSIVSEFASLTNNKPFVSYFTSVNTVRQRLTLNFTSKLFIGAIYTGAAVVMERTPSLGFQPGKYASLDKVEQFRTEGNNFIIGRRLERGHQERLSFRYQDFETIDTWWPDFMEHVLDSKPIFVKWSTTRDQTIFGQQDVKSLPKLRYVTSFHTDISLNINGYI